MTRFTFLKDFRVFPKKVPILFRYLGFYLHRLVSPDTAPFTRSDVI